MVKKYTRKLESREINPETESIWAIQDVPNIWRAKTKTQVEADGYTWNEDGTAVKIEE